MRTGMAAIIEEQGRSELQQAQALAMASVAHVVWRWYEVSLRARIVNEVSFDLRAAKIIGLQNFFRTEEFAQANPGAIEGILADLQSLMPTPEQIEGSRNSSTDRYDELKPIGPQIETLLLKLRKPPPLSMRQK